MAANVSAKIAAPGLRMMSMASTPGTSHMPETRYASGLTCAANSGVQITFHCQKTTPKATPRTLATTMSTARQPVRASAADVVIP
jgi:hypothetical protein